MTSAGASMGPVCGWRICAAAVATAVAACRPLPPALRPREPPPVAAQELPRRSLLQLIARPAALAPRALQEYGPSPGAAAPPVGRLPVATPRLPIAAPPPPVATLPPVRAVLPLVRPRAGGEALELADLALSRGDAFDAAAQYRAVLATGPHRHAPYVQVQLARAYLDLGDAERAEALLRVAARASGQEAWIALSRLGELRAAEVGAVAAASELRDLAGPNAENLEAHLIDRGAPDDAAALLIVMAARTHSCGYVMQALAFGARAVPAWFDSQCLVAAPTVGDAPATAASRAGADGAAMVARNARKDSVNVFLRRFNAAAVSWDALAASVLAGDVAPEPWLALAEEYLATGSLAVFKAHTADTHFGASHALDVAFALLERAGRIDEAQLARLHVLIKQLDPSYRGAAEEKLLQIAAHAASRWSRPAVRREVAPGPPRHLPVPQQPEFFPPPAAAER